MELGLRKEYTHKQEKFLLFPSVDGEFACPINSSRVRVRILPRLMSSFVSFFLSKSNAVAGVGGGDGGGGKILLALIVEILPLFYQPQGYLMTSEEVGEHPISPNFL